MNKIRPCPFCGYDEPYTRLHSNPYLTDDPGYHVYCPNCDAQSSACIEKVGCVNDWNTVSDAVALARKAEDVLA